MTWLEALVLGGVQGLTEFLPISSDGHLTIVQKAFAWAAGQDRPAAETLFFFVMLHLGTLTAILVHYRRALVQGARGLLGETSVPEGLRRGEALRALGLAVVATLPLIPDKVFFMPLIERTFQDPIYAGFGFWITAAVLLATQRLRGGSKGPAETTWGDALLIGVAQMFAPLPGVSRSGLTVAAALARGFDRAWAVRFSLLIAVPAILGAAVSELKDVDPAALSRERVQMTLAGSGVAGLVGYLAIAWLIRVVRANRLWVFSLYLATLGLVVILGASMAQRGHDAGAVDRAVGSRAGRADSQGAGGLRIDPVDRADGARP